MTAAHTLPEDGAAVELARRYARELDEAAVVSAQLAKALRDLFALDPKLHDRFLTLATRIEQTAVTAAIGPKLLAVLEQLAMTPSSRVAQLGRAVGDPGAGGEQVDEPKSKADELRERRAARQHAAAPVD